MHVAALTSFSFAFSFQFSSVFFSSSFISLELVVLFFPLFLLIFRCSMYAAFPFMFLSLFFVYLFLCFRTRSFTQNVDSNTALLIELKRKEKVKVTIVLAV